MAKLPKPDGFETYAEAKRRCAYKVRLLSRGGKREQRLAARLGRCSKADPLCIRGMRHLFGTRPAAALP